jgi:two-component system, CitB family, sensor kinase
VRPRLSLTGQLLALQLIIISVVLVGVAAVTLAQSTARFRDTETRRARTVAETVAANANVRSTLQGDGSLTLLRSTAESARSVSGSSSVVVTDADLTVLASPDPAELGRPFDVSGSDVLQGRAWVGLVRDPDGSTVAAHVPVMSEVEGEVGMLLGVVAVGREHPSLAEVLRLAAPNLLTYLGLASLLGVAGSLLIARRVKRQTFGLDPVEIAGLVEHRGAMLYGIKEGVLGLDLQDRVTLVNDEAAHLLRLPEDAVGHRVSELPIDVRLREALTQRTGVPDQVVPVGGRVLILNSLPITSRGLRIGSVTTLRDRTELLTLQRELDVTRHATDTLRAQAHEFSNRLHTISGLVELGDYGEVVRYVRRLNADVSRITDDVTSRVADPAVAALLIAKGNQADERGVQFVVSGRTRLLRLDEQLSTDVATVVGNLVDNAFDAVGHVAGNRWVELEATEDADEVRVTVRDSGPGVDPDRVEDVFRRGFSTKGSGNERGIGLALVRLVCRRRGGDVVLRNDGGAVFVATLPTPAKVGG